MNRGCEGDDLGRELEATKRFLEDVLASSIEGIVTTDLAGHTTYANPSARAMLGYGPDEMTGLPAGRFYEEGGEAVRRIAEALRRHGALRDHECRLKCRDGGLLDVHMTISLIRNGTGELTGTLGMFQDISEQRRLRDQLYQAQRMEAVGTLAGGIAHNFNNLLMSIQGYTSLVRLNTPKDHPHHDMLRKIETQVAAGGRLTAQLIGFAREGKFEIQPLNLNRLITELADAFGMPHSAIRMELDMDPALPGIMADRGQIEQVLMNLFVNAADAMPDGGRITVRTRVVSHADLSEKPYRLKAGPHVELVVEDTGAGIPAEVISHIFEPFFTTKDLSKGAGLGLASVYGTVKAHCGFIDVTSTPGQGSRFVIYFPAAKAPVREHPEPSPEMHRGTETILLVDDDPMILDVGEKMLAALGYRVLTAAGGPEAMDLWRDGRSGIDLVLIDMIMPGMGGGDLFLAMHRESPRVRVLLSSGHAMDEETRRLIDQGAVGFIQKPFGIRDLSGKIRQILDREPAEATDGIR